MATDFLNRLFVKRHRRLSLDRLRVLESSCRSARDRFEIPFVFQGKGFFKSLVPKQNREEIQNLYRLVCEIEPERILEVGTARGGTLYLWVHAARPRATLVSIDLPHGQFGGAYPEEKADFFRNFVKEGQTLHLLRGDSHQSKTVARVRSLFRGGGIDFAFIDGDHTYDGVWADFHNFRSLMRPGGLMAFHDILPRPDLPAIQVHRFWTEIRGHHRTAEIVGSEGSGRKIGIGLVWIDSGELTRIDEKFPNRL